MEPLIAVTVCLAIIALAYGFGGLLQAMWRRQERRDGLR